MENTIGMRLIKMRKKKNVSRREVAVAVGVSKSAIAMYERSERTPKDSIKKKLAVFFNTSVDALFF